MRWRPLGARLRIARSASIYMLGGMANQAVALALLPVLTRYLTPTDYGYAAMFAALIGFVAPVVDMSMKTHIARNFFKVPHAEMSEINWNSLAAVTMNSAVVFAGFLLLSAAWPGFSETLSGIPTRWALAAVVIVWAQSVGGQFKALLRIMDKAVWFVTFELGTAALNLGLSIVLVVAFSWGWQGRTSGLASSALIAAVVAFLVLRSMGFGRGSLNRGLLKSMYRICLPLVPYAISGQIIAMSSRFFLNGIAGKEAVGLYAVGATFGSLVQMPMDAFTNAWTPWVYKRLAARERTADIEIVRLIYAVGAVLGVLWLLTALVAPLLLAWFTDARYHGAALFVAWVALSFVLQGLYAMLLPILIDEAKTDFLAVLTGVVAGLSLLLNYLLITAYGAMGAAYTAVACAAIKLLLMFWYANNVRPMPWVTALKLGRA